jgi:hypothetical protein
MSDRDAGLMALGAIVGALLGLMLTNVWGAIIGAVAGVAVVRLVQKGAS